MFISRKSLHLNPPSTLFLGSSAVTQVDSFKYLGITLPSDLSWSLNVRNINTKAWKLAHESLIQVLSFHHACHSVYFVY